MLPREFNPRKLHAEVTSTSPAKEAGSGPGATGRGRGGRRSGSGGCRGRARGRGRGSAGDSSAAAAEAAAPAAEGAAVSPRSRWRGPAKGHARVSAAAARRGRPAAPGPEGPDGHAAGQEEAPPQAPAAKAAPMSLKERIAANNAGRRISGNRPAHVAAPGEEGPSHDLGVTGPSGSPAEEEQPGFDSAGDFSKGGEVHVAEIPAAAESEDDLMQPLFLDSDPVQASTP
jgi:hypothetical protein